MRKRKKVDRIQFGWLKPRRQPFWTRLGFTERGWMTTIGMGRFVIWVSWHFEERA